MHDKTYYDRLGGAEKLELLVTTFYRIMDETPSTKVIRDMHQPDLTEASSKLFDFLSGWLGGPQLYQEKYGHPRLRARHLPFPIDQSARDQWIFCMREALNECQVETALQRILNEKFYQLADFMRNVD